MKVKGKLIIKCENAGEMVSILAQSLSPDNVTGIRTEVHKDSATVTFSADKIGTMLSSVDDYLMNAKIAWDMIEKVKNSDQEIYSHQRGCGPKINYRRSNLTNPAVK